MLLDNMTSHFDDRPNAVYCSCSNRPLGVWGNNEKGEWKFVVWFGFKSTLYFRWCRRQAQAPNERFFYFYVLNGKLCQRGGERRWVLGGFSRYRFIFYLGVANNLPFPIVIVLQSGSRGTNKKEIKIKSFNLQKNHQHGNAMRTH